MLGPAMEELLPDGLYDSINFLKTEAHHPELLTSETYKNGLEVYEWIMKLCQNGSRITKLSLDKTKDILKSIRPSVNDIFRSVDL